MARSLDHEEPGIGIAGGPGFGAGERDHVGNAVDDQDRRLDAAQLRPQVKLAQAGPRIAAGDRLTSDRFRFVGADVALEIEAVERLGVCVHPQQAHVEFAADRHRVLGLLPDIGIAKLIGAFDHFGFVDLLHAPSDLALHLAQKSRGRRGRGVEDQTLDAVRMLDGVKRREQAAPRVADQVHTLELEVPADGLEVGDVVLIAELLAVGHQLGTALPALVVIDDAAVLRQGLEIRPDRFERIARPAVHYYERLAAPALDLVEDANVVRCDQVTFVGLPEDRGCRQQEQGPDEKKNVFFHVNCHGIFINYKPHAFNIICTLDRLCCGTRAGKNLFLRGFGGTHGENDR